MLGASQVSGGWRAEEGIELEGQEYRKWEDEASPENVSLISLYTTFLIGQYAGMTDALDLSAARAAVEIARVDEEEQPEMIARLIVLHRLIREEQRPREKK